MQARISRPAEPLVVYVGNGIESPIRESRIFSSMFLNALPYLSAHHSQSVATILAGQTDCFPVSKVATNRSLSRQPAELPVSGKPNCKESFNSAFAGGQPLLHPAGSGCAGQEDTVEATDGGKRLCQAGGDRQPAAPFPARPGPAPQARATLRRIANTAAGTSRQNPLGTGSGPGNGARITFARPPRSAFFRRVAAGRHQYSGARRY